jgi:ATP-dependent Lon protease
MLKLPNGTIRVLVEGLSRAKIQGYTDEQEFYEVDIEEWQEATERTPEADALMRTVLGQFESYINLSKKVSPETLSSVADITEPGRLADAITSHLNLKIKEKQELLEMVDVQARLTKLIDVLTNEREVFELERKISHRVKKQMEKTQKEYYLREQMKAIQKELGDREGRTGEIEDLRAQLAKLELPEAAHEKVSKEIDRLEKMPMSSAEGSLVRSYIDTLMALPWSKMSQDTLDLGHAEAVLNEDHYGLEKPKERILEYLAVQKLVGQMKGPILCFVGPPGVGKTSIGRSIARALDREFIRISLGGVRDEAEIRGHRRTYIGALPGRIMNGLKQAGTKNPVILLDEIDKMASDFRGDPASALLEVLDPNQNHTFSDHYIEIPFDLSQVMFITTANTLHSIPRPLLDRMEIQSIPGYTELEKQHIATDYLLPKQKKDHGLKPEQVSLTDEALLALIRSYTREAGVRQLDQQLAALCRKSAKAVVAAPDTPVAIDAADLKTYLGKSRYRFGLADVEDQIGAVTGLAWTEVGGDTLNIEVTVLPGTGKLTLTGKLGEVMQESAHAAFSYIRSRAAQFHLEEGFHEKVDIHIHVPEGAIPKDGPSAGITIATAIVSALSNTKVAHDVAMTGEITLRGRVLPIGGLKEKSLAAHRAGIKTVLLPKENEKDLEDIPDSIKEAMQFITVSHMDEVIQHALVKPLGDL